LLVPASFPRREPARSPARRRTRDLGGLRAFTSRDTRHSPGRLAFHAVHHAVSGDAVAVTTSARALGVRTRRTDDDWRARARVAHVRIRSRWRLRIRHVLYRGRNRAGVRVLRLARASASVGDIDDRRAGSPPPLERNGTQTPVAMSPASGARWAPATAMIVEVMRSQTWVMPSGAWLSTASPAPLVEAGSGFAARAQVLKSFSRTSSDPPMRYRRPGRVLLTLSRNRGTRTGYCRRRSC
jgi:hypothetical protein